MSVARIAVPANIRGFVVVGEFVQHKLLLIEDTAHYASVLFTALEPLGEVIKAQSIIEATAQCDALHPSMILALCPYKGLDAETILSDLASCEHKAPILILERGLQAKRRKGLIADGAWDAAESGLAKRAFKEKIRSALALSIR